MPLSEQERRCIDLASGFLSGNLGGTWTVQDYLDEMYVSEPSPEVVITNGQITAAIEVKRLPGDSIYQAYLESLISNQRFLTPSCGGYYVLEPPIDFRIPLPPDIRRLVKREIGLVAPTLRPGDKGAIRLPRSGHISLISESGPPYVTCCHGGPLSSFPGPIADSIPGKMILIDEGLEHSFVTEEGWIAFYEAVVSAYHLRVNGDASKFTWFEEWRLERLEEDDQDTDEEKDGVWVLTVTEARDVKQSVAECVYTVLQNALRKFERRCWAEHHVVVLESSMNAPKRLVTPIIEDLNITELGNVNLVLLVEDETITQCYPPFG